MIIDYKIEGNARRERRTRKIGKNFVQILGEKKSLTIVYICVTNAELTRTTSYRLFCSYCVVVLLA